MKESSAAYRHYRLLSVVTGFGEKRRIRDAEGMQWWGVFCFGFSSSIWHFVVDGLCSMELWPHILFTATFRSFSSMMTSSFLKPIYTFDSIMFCGVSFTVEYCRKIFHFVFRLVACTDYCTVRK